MTRSPHADPTAALMKAGNALVFARPDNNPADRIVDFRSDEAQCASVSAAQSNSSGRYYTVVISSVHSLKIMRNMLPPKADIAESDWHVRFVPNSEILGLAARRIVAKIAHS